MDINALKASIVAEIDATYSARFQKLSASVSKLAAIVETCDLDPVYKQEISRIKQELSSDQELLGTATTTSATVNSANDSYLNELNERFNLNINDINNNLQNLENLFSTKKHKDRVDASEPHKVVKPGQVFRNTPTENSPPMYTFQQVSTVKELLDEYFVGINGGKPVRELERTFGAQWRGGSKHSVSKQFNRRKSLYFAVENAMERGKSLDECAEILERARTYYNYEDQAMTKKGINWLCQNLPKL